MTTPPMPRNNIPGIVAYEKDGLQISFNFEKDSTNPTLLRITLVAINTLTAPLTEFVFQAAVPKTFKLQMLPPSGNYLPPSSSGNVTQSIIIDNPLKQQQLRMKTRISYTVNGKPVLEQGEVNNFPPQLNQF